MRAAQLARRPRRAVGLVFDGFDRPNGPIGAADSGQAWQSSGASWVVAGGAAQPGSTAITYTYIPMPGPADVSVSATVAAVGGMSLICRQAGGNFYLLSLSLGTNLRLFRSDAGAATAIAGTVTPGGLGVGTKLGIRAIGNQIQGLVNDQVVTTATDSTYSASTYTVNGDDGRTFSVVGNSVDATYAIILTAQLGTLAVGQLLRLYNGGVLKEATVFTVTGLASAFGFTNVSLSPSAAVAPVTGDQLRGVAATYNTGVGMRTGGGVPTFLWDSFAAGAA